MKQNHNVKQSIIKKIPIGSSLSELSSALPQLVFVKTLGIEYISINEIFSIFRLFLGSVAGLLWFSPRRVKLTG